MHKILQPENYLYLREQIKFCLFRIIIFLLWIALFPFAWFIYSTINFILERGLFSNIKSPLFNILPREFIVHFEYTILILIIPILCILILSYIILSLMYIHHFNCFADKPKYTSASQYARIKARACLLRSLKYIQPINLAFLILAETLAALPFCLFIYLDPTVSFNEFNSFVGICGIIAYSLMESCILCPYFLLLYWLIKRDYKRQMKLHLNSYTPLAYSFNKLLGINFDHLNGHEFEQYCATILDKIGYEHIIVTPKGHDQGVDILAFKKGIKYAIQCKCYQNTVGNKAIQEIVAGKVFYQCQEGIVITNNYFTKSAKALAKANDIILWDRKDLIKMFQEASIYPD